VALWVGDNPKPKLWFDSVEAATEYLSHGLKRKDGEQVHIAALQLVKLEFSVKIVGTGPTGAAEQA
jgi:hypothetical protein